MKSVALLLTFVIGCLVEAKLAFAQTTRLDRYQLLQFRAADGSIQPVIQPEQWQQRRAEIVQGMVQVTGPFPANDRRVPIDIQVEQEDDLGSYVRRLITYQSEPDCRTPAWLCIPKAVLTGTQQAPAALCLHPTDNVAGHNVVVGLAGREGRQYAAELAERGYVTLSPAYPHLANYWPNLQKLGYISGTMKAIWDSSRGIDLLASLPYVEMKHGVAAIGHSLGGHNAIYSAVFDERISVVVSSCGFDSYLDYYDGNEDVWLFDKGWCQIRYMPMLSNFRGHLSNIPFDFPELLGVLAPRSLFVNAPLGDSNFRWKSVDQCIAAALPVYQLLLGSEDVSSRIQVLHPDCPHDFPDEARQAAYAMIDAVLRPHR